jgi:predicted nucleic acid-binding protein
VTTATPSVVLVDSNVLLDIRTEDPVWFAWSSRSLADTAERHELAINPIIYAEVATDVERIEELDAQLPERDYRRLPLPYDAGFLAARAFFRYRRSGGRCRSPLPDFYIGAHAAVRGLVLLTRDAARYRTYFPTVTLISPG